MLDTLSQYFYMNVKSIGLMLMVINAILHVIFAGAVAKDGGYWEKQGGKTLLVSSITWAFATLLGGVFVAIAYWLIHHSTLRKGV